MIFNQVGKLSGIFGVSHYPGWEINLLLLGAKSLRVPVQLGGVGVLAFLQVLPTWILVLLVQMGLGEHFPLSLVGGGAEESGQSWVVVC